MTHTQESYINLQVSDGTTMAAYVAYPQERNEQTPAILVLQEAFGVNSHIRNVADRFAREGYVAIAPELFHRTAPQGFTGSYSDFPAVMPHMQALTNEGMSADLQAAYNWLVQQDINKDAIYSVGYCLGGRVSFLANGVLPLKAAVSYYGGRTEQLADQAVNLHGPHLFFWGGLDKHIPDESINTVIKAVKDAGKEYVNVKISYADHGFNCDERDSFNEKASRQAWALTLEFLRSQ
ncbi:dienelactone hydrolase family protein [Mucilaginibacter sp. Bleaf8]|uniref:dienelactone hydrolase family protein n=1 Tax=Mucilaginibacter sp. Bleaf8 TaxID=2834430 RepID=UPI001BCBF267|nr:dienelactone hydrolase family protein [Mucilaginibacter sp. Bleaf8]MBS7566393.1 dienelactone hydrolase family protein [Mucilaginibacter sp. Bleaf8]